MLTKQEHGIVRLVAEGLRNRDIARHMSLSENTVRNYVFRIFDKLGTANRVELALYSVRQQM
jgi:DNA-binding NarL/FixJ family response regulator